MAENKTPYEIRLEILKISKDLLMEGYYQKREEERSNWEVETENAKAEKRPISILKYSNTLPTEDQIIEKAKKLNEFISNK